MSTKKPANKFTVEPRSQEDGKQWAVIWNFPDGDKEIVRTYPHRQAAYRRAKQLNENNTPPRTLYVQIYTERQYCRDICRAIGKHGQMAVYVIDLLSEEHPEDRYVRFGIIVRFHEDHRVGEIPGTVQYGFFDEQPPLERDVLEWVEALRHMPGVRNLETSYHSFPV